LSTYRVDENAGLITGGHGWGGFDYFSGDGSVLTGDVSVPWAQAATSSGQIALNLVIGGGGLIVTSAYADGVSYSSDLTGRLTGISAYDASDTDVTSLENIGFARSGQAAPEPSTGLLFFGCASLLGVLRVARRKSGWKSAVEITQPQVL
jgi:hypothetical protein